MASETKEQDKQISSDSVIQERLAENLQYDDIDKMSLLAPTNKNLGSLQHPDMATDPHPPNEIRDVGARHSGNRDKDSQG